MVTLLCRAATGKLEQTAGCQLWFAKNEQSHQSCRGAINVQNVMSGKHVISEVELAMWPFPEIQILTFSVVQFVKARYGKVCQSCRGTLSFPAVKHIYDCQACIFKFISTVSPVICASSCIQNKFSDSSLLLKPFSAPSQCFDYTAFEVSRSCSQVLGAGFERQEF